MTSRIGVVRLLWRHATTGVGASGTVAIVVLVVAALAVGVPRATQLLVTGSVQHEVGSLPVTSRDLVAEAFGGPVIGPSVETESPFAPEVDAVWGSFEDGLASIRREMPANLERNVGDVQYAVSLVPNKARADWDGAPDSEIALGFDPRMLDHATLVAGTLPVATTQTVPNTQPTEIMLSQTIATRMEWEIGEMRELRTPDGSQPLRLSGTFEANDQNDPYWRHVVASLRPSIEVIGLAPPVVIGVGFAHPASWEHVVPFSAGARMHAWFPVQPETLTAENAAVFASAVRQFTRSAHQVDDVSFDDVRSGRYSMFPVTELGFGSRVTTALDDAIATTSAAGAVLAMTASGPIGVVLAVLLLGARLIVDRRGAGLQLAAARGASRRQLRSTLAIEGLGLGLPAAALGAVVGALMVPGTPHPTSLLLPTFVGLMPAVLLATAPAATGMRRTRSDLEPRSAGTRRWIIEVMVLAAAGIAVFLLVRRGLTTTGAIVDPLLAAVPLLLALAACVVVLRLYPLPLSAVVRAAGRGRGLVAFLGAARGLRDPAARLAPVLAMVVGVSVAVFSGAMLSTVSAGIEESAKASVGADLLVSSQAITAEQAGAIAATPGVVATAPVYAEVRVTVTFDGERDYLTVIVVDAAELAAVQHGDPGSIQNLNALTEAGDAVPVIASDAVADKLADASEIAVEREAVAVVGTAPSEGPMSDRRAWMIVDRTNARQLVGTIYSPARIFVDLDDVASATEVRDQIRGIVQSSATVLTPADAAAQLRSNPVVSGLQGALIAALLVISFLSTIAVVMTLARGGATRGRLLSMLGTLGLGRRAAGGIVAWELAPMTVAALVAGTALGLLLPAIVLAGVDLTLFTGGTGQPAVTIDPLLTLLVTGGFVLLVLAATTLAVVASRRVDAATVLRTIEE